MKALNIFECRFVAGAEGSEGSSSSQTASNDTASTRHDLSLSGTNSNGNTTFEGGYLYTDGNNSVGVSGRIDQYGNTTTMIRVGTSW